ncbi:ewing's tumor-associated antigen 1 [Trichomycterus rosablanca]|uniref:ewing's tumor-associated antigen 1 n=1 Tax=Trichomycterus rosablanca TaxID=2290929 RepID=UPI002F35FDAE
MTDRTILDSRPAADESRETRSRVSKLTQNRFKSNKHNKARKHERSPSLRTSICSRKDLETPKRRSRIRFFGGSNGDSPSETETQQDIIWDPASPPSVRNGKGAGEGFRIVEISDIVNRIAPHNEKPVDKDSVLQWIGDSAIPCTPEIEQPRVRRCSVRRQSSNVEDLMKLAKQFDLNMTRQDKERNLERLQDGEERTSDDVHKLNNHLDSRNNGSSFEVQNLHSVKPKVLSHEEELHALFDGPTQYQSGRLSPPSANCSQESRSEPVAQNRKRQAPAEGKSISEDPAPMSKLDFDDDWENDALLDDLFVLEVTQNPDILSSVSTKTTGQTRSAASVKCGSTTATSSSGLSSKTGCSSSLQRGSVGQYTKISSKTCTKPSSIQTCTTEKLPKISPDSSKKAESANQAWAVNQQADMPTDSGMKKNKTEKTESPAGKDLPGLAKTSGNDVKKLDLNSLWGDGDDDDDLLYQVCDDVERISASQEQQTENIIKPTPNTSSSSSSSNVSRSKTVQSDNPIKQKPVHVFVRSHSIPGASGSHVDKLELSRVNHNNYQNSRLVQHQHGQLKSGSALKPQGTNLPAEKSSVSHHSTFKRHQSDPVPMSNKVFVTALTAVKCTAAEIEKKKQEAIARRRSRLQATQKPGAPT